MGISGCRRRYAVLKSKVYESFDQAVADVPDGATIMFPGFAMPGTPRNLIAALLRQGAKDLTGISNAPGGRDEVVDIGALISAGRVRKMICAFTASPHPSVVTPFDKLYQAGEIEAELVPQGTLAERIRAAGAGIGAFYTRSGAGTEVADGKESRIIDGKEYILEYSLPADYAFIRAWRADSWGNLQYRLSQRNFNPIMAMAADVTIVEVEEEILEPGAIDPDHVHTPGVFVDRVVKIPPDGIWEKPVYR